MTEILAHLHIHFKTIGQLAPSGWIRTADLILNRDLLYR